MLRKINELARRVTAASAAFLLVFQSVSASVLGSSQISGHTVQIGDGAYFSHNVFYSDQNGVGRQTENYFTYTPNENTKPILAYSEYVYGKKNIYEVMDYLSQNDVNMLAGMNSDYFSLQTGVPMSDAIVDGKILTKDLSGKDAIGFNEDGTAFISWLEITSNLHTRTQNISIYHINKYRQPYGTYLFDENFADTTKATSRGLNVVINPTEGEMAIGKSIKGVIESKEIVYGDFTIPRGKLVLSVDCKAPSELYEPVNQLIEGEEITITFGANDERWSNATLAAGSVGGRLLTNGEINDNPKNGAAPRTAIGVKADGSAVFYTIDGRQTGYSYGVQLQTLALRMKELGCVDAINLDGGGSTTMAVKYPGKASLELVNKPSDGRVRKVSNFLFLQNMLKPTSELGQLHFTPLEPMVLTNSSINLGLLATDTGFYAMEVPRGAEYSVADGFMSTIDQNGAFTARDNGYVRVNARIGDVVGSVDVLCLSTPTDIRVINEATGKSVSGIEIKPGGVYEFSAEGYGGLNKFVSQDTAFTWSVEGSIGSIDQNGTFTAANRQGAAGKIKVECGGTVKYINVDITDDEVNADPKNFPNATVKAQNGVIEGTIADGYGIPIYEADIHLKVDGKEIPHAYNAETNTVTADFPNSNERKFYKITLYVTNELGYSGYSSAEIGDMSDLENVFSDSKGHWAQDVLSYMAQCGIIDGEIVDGKKAFRPNKAMSRAEFAAMITRYMGVNAKDYKNTELPYADVDEIPAWAVNNFKAMHSLGIIQGKYLDDKTVVADPMGQLTRAEAVTIISRTLAGGFKTANIGFSDSNDIPQWARLGFNKLISLGAIGGYEDGSLLPLRFLSKAEAVKILYSVF